MVVETQAKVNGKGIELVTKTVELPTALIGTIYIQGTIHKLLLESFHEGSKTKLLQAILLDSPAPTYYQACAMIDEMCELQKDILPVLEWKQHLSEYGEMNMEKQKLIESLKDMTLEEKLGQIRQITGEHYIG